MAPSIVNLFFMKILCACGHVIRDQTDYLPYKAHFVGDQDYFDFSEAIEEQIKLAADLGRSALGQAEREAGVQQAIKNAHEAIDTYMKRVIYQCSACGRLLVDDAQFQLQGFAPQEDSVPKNLMRSIEGNLWKFPMGGRWTEQDRGELWWGPGNGDDGFERYDDLETLTTRYFEVFAQLQEKRVLRSAFFQRGDELLHRWP